MFSEKQEILQIPRIPVKVLRGNNIPSQVVWLEGQRMGGGVPYGPF